MEQLTIKEITAKAKCVKGPHENILGSASVALKFETGEYITLSGFTIWKSQYEGQPLNVTLPKTKRFTYCLIEKSLWRKIKAKIIDVYDRESIAEYVKNQKPQ
jgi:hypothetical protein